MLNEIEDLLKKQDVEYKKDVPLSKLSSMGVGGDAALAVYPDSIERLCGFISLLRERSIKHRVVGRMTNILPPDGRYDGVLVLTTRINRFRREDKLLFAECGADLSRVIGFMAYQGYGGAEGLSSIPGTVGGAVSGNAGAFGADISDVFIKGRFLSPMKGIVELSKDQVSFAYRSCGASLNGYIFLDGVFEFREIASSDILAKIRELKDRRARMQPTGSKSLGSIFKRVGDTSAGYYIDKAGLKGLKVGGALVSEKHAGFIINLGNATCEDISKLIGIIKKEVYSSFGVELIEEIKYLEGG